MSTSLIFMLTVQGTVILITGILYYKILTTGKKGEDKKEDKSPKK